LSEVKDEKDVKENLEKDAKEDLETDASKELDDVDYKEDKEATDSKDKKKKKEKKDSKTVEIENLNAEIGKLKAEIDSWKNEYLKARAELENSKKRISDQAAIERKYASQHVIGELVQPVDMLVQIVNMPASSDEVKNYQIGFQMIANQLADILKNEGLKPIEVKIGEQFDPKFMQALDVVSDETKEDGSVISIRQNGYLYKDRILRPAMVIVNKIKKAEPEKEEPIEEKEETKGE